MAPGQVDANASRRPKGYLVGRQSVFLEELRYFFCQKKLSKLNSLNMISSRGLRREAVMSLRG